MGIKITLSGYRCFAPQEPASVTFTKGLTALIGLNNTGKSAFLRAIYELRDVFIKLSTSDNHFSKAVMGSAEYKPVEEIGDYKDVFWHFAKEDAIVEISLPQSENAHGAFWKATIRLHYGDQPTFSLTIHDFSGIPLPAPDQIRHAIRFSDDDVRNIIIGSVAGDPTQLISAFKILSQCFYCPSTRHATAFAPDSRARGLYDIMVGKPFIDDWQFHQTGAGKDSTEMIDAIISDIQQLFRYDRPGAPSFCAEALRFSELLRKRVGNDYSPILTGPSSPYQ